MSEGKLAAPLASLFGAAEAYEKMTGGWPARIAKNLVETLPTPITSTSVVLDNACGSGAVTTAIVNATKPNVPKINAVDLSPGMIEHVKTLTKDIPQVQTSIMDIQDLKFEDNTFSHVICAFGVFFAPDYEKGYSEMYRVAAPGSTTVVTSWKTLGWKPLVDYVIKKIRPDQPGFRFPAPSGFSEAEWVKEQMEKAGWKDVTVREIQDWTYQESMTGAGQTMLPMTTGVREGWSDEENKRWIELFDEAAEAVGLEKLPEGGWKIDMLALAASGTK